MDNPATEETTGVDPAPVPARIDQWDDLEISTDLLRGIYSMGFEKPSNIQQVAVRPIMEGHDIIAQAQSGTGKTAAFSIGALQRVNVDRAFTQVLILSPTRELTTQTASVIQGLGSCIKGLQVKTHFGGSRPSEDGGLFIRSKVPHIICGCPGRVYDLIRRGHISTTGVSLIILDEADEMLSTGFYEQITDIFRTLPEDVQIALFSATVPDSMQTITQSFMRNPVRICVQREQLTLEGIKQYYIAVYDDSQKYDTLLSLFSHITMSQCIIYCNSIRRVKDLYEAMHTQEYPVCHIHGEMDKVDRERAFSEFKSGKYRVLISSDITSRGIDIQQVSIVINFDVPRNVHTYLHRIGRSGRWGRKGTSINFITPFDKRQLVRIEEHYGTQIQELPEEGIVL